MPKHEVRRLRSMPWSTVSKAADKSSSSNTTDRCSSIALGFLNSYKQFVHPYVNILFYIIITVFCIYNQINYSQSKLVSFLTYHILIVGMNILLAFTTKPFGQHFLAIIILVYIHSKRRQVSSKTLKQFTWRKCAISKQRQPNKAWTKLNASWRR